MQDYLNHPWALFETDVIGDFDHCLHADDGEWQNELSLTCESGGGWLIETATDAISGA